MGVRTTAAVTATAALLGAGAAAVAAGRYAGDFALRSGNPPLPAGFTGPPVTVHGVTRDEIALTRSLATVRPGIYGLTGPGCHAVVGSPVEEGPRQADTVVRRLERVTRGELRAGAQLWLTPQLYAGDPLGALGLDYSDVEIGGELGSLPAWFVPGARDTWVIALHGLGAGREHPLNVLPYLHRLRFPVLVPGHRADPASVRRGGAGPGFEERAWHDADAALRCALRYGARQVVLYGWSAGGAMALRTALRSPLRGSVAGVVADSPVLDWPVTVEALAAHRGVPRPLRPLAVRAVLGQDRLGPDPAVPPPGGAGTLPPTLILHGPDDTVAPWRTSRELAARHPEHVVLHPVGRAQHAAMWNADPQSCEEALRRFLTPLM